MHKTKEQLSITSGALSTFAILLVSASLTGCGTVPSVPTSFQPARSVVVLTEQDLNYFQIDCEHKKEQVVLLQGQRRTKADVSLWGMVAIGYRPLTERRNWLINHHLTDLRNLCYD